MVNYDSIRPLFLFSNLPNEKENNESLKNYECEDIDRKTDRLIGRLVKLCINCLNCAPKWC